MLRRKRPRGVLGLGWACIESAANGRTEHCPTSADYPDTVVRRVSLRAGGGLPWRISALTSPRAKPAPWKIVVITGSPSWAEYWAPAVAALPEDREIIVVDRPGFAGSEPAECVPEIAVQARALAPLLKAARGQKILLVGQSYGASVATLMAAAEPRRVNSLALISSYFGEPGPTARWLVATGSKVLGVIPRDLRNAVLEVSGHGAQMPKVREALLSVRAPIHLIHGDQDDFAPIDTARRVANEMATRVPIRFTSVPGANHFLNDGPTETLLGALEACMPAPALRRQAWRLPSLPDFLKPAGGLGSATAGA
jgi:pimeloyl-ACP methyl ester carboxylesterase